MCISTAVVKESTQQKCHRLKKEKRANTRAQEAQPSLVSHRCPYFCRQCYPGFTTGIHYDVDYYAASLWIIKLKIKVSCDWLYVQRTTSGSSRHELSQASWTWTCWTWVETYWMMNRSAKTHFLWVTLLSLHLLKLLTSDILLSLYLSIYIKSEKVK